jgi:hypothetical protein
MPLVSEADPRAAESAITSLVLGTFDIIPEELWDEAVADYFGGRYLSAAILGGTCAETAHRCKCRSAGMATQNVHWVTLIRDSITSKAISAHVGNVLDRIRTNYRNKWVHVDIDEISKAFPIPSGAGSKATTPTCIVVHTSRDQYKSIFTSLSAKQEALNCLWLTAVALDQMYGGTGYLDEPSIS